MKPPICLMYPKLQNDTGKRGYTNRIFLRGEAGTRLKCLYSVLLNIEKASVVTLYRLGHEGQRLRGLHGPSSAENGLLPENAVVASTRQARFRKILGDDLGVIWPAMANLQLVAIVVRDYDPAIRFFVDVLGFELVEDMPSVTNDERPKRWVVVRPVGGQTGILLARADGDHQARIVGEQFAGRVGLFLRVDDFEASYQRMVAAGVRFLSPPRNEAYGTLAVFLDLEGNRWDLLGPDPR